MKQPVCTIIAGVNGSGKTTFALNYLTRVRHYRHFINADLIASGLSPLLPEQQQIAASRLFLQQIKQAVIRRENFAFETTLSGRGYLKLIRQLQVDDWFVELIYLYLPSVQLSIERVAERVRHGGITLCYNLLSDAIPEALITLSITTRHCEYRLNRITYVLL